MRKLSLFLGPASLLALAWACGGGTNCPPGYEGCVCATDGQQAPCNTGLSCASGICVDPTAQSGSGGGSSFDEATCRSCWESQCQSQVDACEAATACGELSNCLVDCFAQGGDVACFQGCSDNATNADVDSLTALGNLQACVATSCTQECYPVEPGGSGGSGNGSGGDTGSGGGSGGDIIFLEPTRELRPLDGWVHLEENTVGIQGPVYVFSDQQIGTSITLNATGRNFCVSGITSTIPCDALGEVCAYDTYWGAGAGINLAELPDTEMPGPYNATAAGVTGVAFTISGPNVPPMAQLRFKAVVYGQSDVDYCINIPSGANSISFTDLKRECWAPISGSVDESAIEAIQWQIVASELQSVSFDFCINDIRVLP